MSSNGSIEVGELKIAKPLFDLIQAEMAPGTGVDPDSFWKALGEITRELGPKNRELLEKRDTIQAKIDAWHRDRKGKPIDAAAYRSFLEEIDYLVPEKEDFTITTINVDPEIAAIAGPQLVVPVDNARYALNAANARWGSLYDALYGTNIIPEENGAEKGSRYNPVRGARVIAYTDHFLDETVTLSKGSYCQATAFMLEELQGKQQLIVMLQDEKKRTWQILPNLWDTGKAMEN